MRIVRIVRLVRMSKHPIGERGSDRAAHDIRSRHGGDRITAIRAREADGKAPRGQIRPRDHGRECIEDHLLRLLDRGVGQFTIARLAHVTADRCGGSAAGALRKPALEAAITAPAFNKVRRVRY